MHVVIVFVNIGFYHLARIRAAAKECSERNWQLTAVQLTSNTLDHPWGDVMMGLDVEIVTLLNNDVILQSLDGLPHISNNDLYRAINHINPDVVFIPGWGFEISRKLLRWSRKNKRSTVVMSDSKYDDDHRIWWKESIKRLLYVRNFDAALVAGDAHARYIEKLGVPKNKVFKGYDAVDNEYFYKSAMHARENESEIRIRYPKMPKNLFFIAVFRLMPRKNGAKLISAYSEYCRVLGVDAWDLVICGEGDQREELLSIIQSLELNEKVHLVGFLRYDEVGHWYGLAEALVHPSLQEQWGLVINEACAAGLPIIASKTAGASESLISNGVNGYLFDPEYIGDISSSLIKFHRLEKKQRYEMSNASIKMVDEISPHKFGKSFAEAAISAIQGKNHA